MKTRNNMKFPIIKKKGKPFYPTYNICPICGEDRTKLNSNFFVLMGGALKKVDKNTSVMSDDLSGFLSLMYHEGNESKFKGTSFNIVENSKSGQFDIHFCSINCLRKFFSDIVNTLENRLIKNKP